ncbi:MAG: hypothetical protein EBU08_10500 [Micrococcales bacterium]|nr:hypothetical protein [Micrococcales bacterium]
MDRIRSSAYHSYHMVDHHSLDNPSDVIALNAVKEINKRVDYTRKYYRNRYDKPHKEWMMRLGDIVQSKTIYKVGLSLDALIALKKMQEEN